MSKENNTKEEIAEQHCGSSHVMDKRYRNLYGHRDNIYKAMDEWAEIKSTPLLEALKQCESYFDNIADADYVGGYQTNKEMKLLILIREVMKKVEL